MPTETVNRRHNRHPAQSLHALQIAEALLKIQTVIAVTGRSESTIRRRVAEGTRVRHFDHIYCPLQFAGVI